VETLLSINKLSEVSSAEEKALVHSLEQQKKIEFCSKDLNT